MAKWGKRDLGSNTSTSQDFLTNSSPGLPIANAFALFHNNTPNAFKKGAVVGLYGISPNNIVSNSSVSYTGPGWTLITQGTGPVKNVTANPGGIGYNNTDILSVSGNNCVNAFFNPITNSTGGIISFKSINGNKGSGFPNSSYCTISMGNSTGGNSTGNSAAFHLFLGGRANRIKKELLVSIQSMSNVNIIPVPPIISTPNYLDPFNSPTETP